MIAKDLKTKIECFVGQTASLSEEESLECAKLLLLADEKIQDLEKQVVEKEKVIEANIQKTMDELAVFLMKGMNLQ
jgi:hypothetical protein